MAAGQGTTIQPANRQFNRVWSSDAAGFLRGTRIRTTAGERPVEELAAGMTVLTLRGAHRTVVWVGHRALHLGSHPDPESARPVRVRRGALGNGMPARDVVVSPDHGLFLNTALIPVRELVNGATVLPDMAATTQTMHLHAVALDLHDVLLADAAPFESVPDSRLAKGNVIALHPSFPSPPPVPEDCAPRAVRGSVVQMARSMLLSRARLLGHALTNDPDLHLLVDGVRLNPSGVAGQLYRFSLPPGAADIRVVSRAGIPAETDPAAQDRRRLGIMLSRIVLRTTGGTFEITAADPALREGFHPPERSPSAAWRWTDGHARLPVIPPGLTRLDLYVLGAQPSWARAAPPSAPLQRGA